MKQFLFVPTIFGLALVWASANADEGSAVSGTVIVKGGRSSADIVVSLSAGGAEVLPAKKPVEPVEMDQKGMLFIPRVLPVVKGTTVRFLNSDPVPHNVFSPEGKYNLGTWPTGETRDHLFDKPGVHTQLCRVHPEMEAFVVVLETSYFAVTDKTGRFQIDNVPPAQYTLAAWGVKLKKYSQPVTVESGKPVAVDFTMTR